METKNYQNTAIWDTAVNEYSKTIEFLKRHCSIRTAFVGGILLDNIIRPAIILRRCERKFDIMCSQEMAGLKVHIVWKNPYMGEDTYEVIDSFDNAHVAYKRLMFNNYIICLIGPNGENLGLTRSDMFFCFTDPKKDLELFEKAK